MKRLVLAVIAAALLAAGCSTRTVTVTAHTHTATPTVAATTVAINKAVQTECSRFQQVNTAIESDTAGESTVGQLMPTVSADAVTWEHGLTAAYNTPMTGVPQGHNLARDLNHKIAEANLAVAILKLEVDLNKVGSIPRYWTNVTTALDNVQTACP